MNGPIEKAEPGGGFPAARANREIVRLRKAEEATALGEVSIRDLQPSRRDFRYAVMSRRSYLVLVAGVVRCDPSAAWAREDLDLVALAHQAEEAGAAAVAIGTDAALFGGDIGALHATSRSLRVPVLRLDYVLDLTQIQTSRLAGADAVLVSAGMLARRDLNRLHEAARALEMHVVLEARDETELERAVAVPGAIIGLGDLTGETGRWSGEQVLALADRAPERATLLALCGVRGRADLELFQGRLDAALVTAAWLGADDPAAGATLFGT
jgi:indole-3-glycerol phosphate synthase